MSTAAARPMISTSGIVNSVAPGLGQPPSTGGGAASARPASGTTAGSSQGVTATGGSNIEDVNQAAVTVTPGAKVRDININQYNRSAGQQGLYPELLLQEVVGQTLKPATTLRPAGLYQLVVLLKPVGAGEPIVVDGPMTLSVVFYDKTQAAVVIDLPILWTGSVEPQMLDNGLMPPPETIELPGMLPIGTASLCLKVLTRKPPGPHSNEMTEDRVVYTSPDTLTLQGNFVPKGAPALKAAHVNVDRVLPRDGAIVNVLQAGPGAVNLRYNTGAGGTSELYDQPVIWTQPTDAAKIIAAMTKFSIALPALKQCFSGISSPSASPLRVLVFDSTGLGAPWEALDLGARRFLGTLGSVARWASICEREVSFAEDLRSGRVLALNAPAGLLDAWAVDAVDSYSDLLERLVTSPTDYALIYINCRSSNPQQIDQEICGDFNFAPIDGPRPVCFLDGPGTLCMSYTQGVAVGLAASILANIADGVFGFEGGNDDNAAHLVHTLLRLLTPMIAASEALRQMREQSLARWSAKTADPAEMATALLCHYYGNPMLCIALTPAATGGVQP